MRKQKIRRRKKFNPVVKVMGAIALMTGLFSAFAFAAPSRTGLIFCNRGSQGKVHVAVAYPTGQDTWSTEGWLHLEEGQCESAIPGKLTNRYYYYFAETDSDYAWKGEQPFCVSSKKFTFLHAQAECKGKTSRWVKFRELDTGNDADNYTLNLE